MQKRKKSIIWPYLLAGGVFVLGIIFMIYQVFAIVDDFSASDLRFIAPQSEVVLQLEPGEYTVYYEYKTYFEEVYYDTGNSINGLKLKIKNTLSNEEVKVKNSTFSSSYTNSDGSGVSVLDFEIKKSGEFKISSSFTDSEHEKVILSIGKTMAWNFINSVFGIFAILIGSMLLSVLIAIFGAKWEKKRNSELNEHL